MGHRSTRELLQWVAAGSALAALAIAPVPIRIWLGETDRWFLPALQDADHFPWRLIIEHWAPLETMVIAAVCVGALLGAALCALIRIVDHGRFILPALRWALRRLLPWLFLVVCLVVIPLSKNNGSAQLAAMALMAVTMLMLPFVVFNPAFAAQPETFRPARLPMVAVLQSAVVVVLIQICNSAPGAIGILAWIVGLALHFTLIVMLMRRQTLAQMLRDRDWLSWHWVISSLTMSVLSLLLLAPIIAWVLLLKTWLTYEVPNIETLMPEFDLPDLLVAFVSHATLLEIPAVVWLTCADSRLAWLYGIATKEAPDTTELVSRR